jgi:hypothetical protein
LGIAVRKRGTASSEPITSTGRCVTATDRETGVAANTIVDTDRVHRAARATTSSSRAAATDPSKTQAFAAIETGHTFLLLFAILALRLTKLRLAQEYQCSTHKASAYGFE